MSGKPFDRQLISESLRQLRQLERQHEGTAAADRIGALILLKSDPTLTIAAVAARLRRSSRAVYRWLEHYREGGVAALVAATVRRGRPRRVGTEAIRALRAQLDGDRLRRIEDVREYLNSHFGLDLSPSGVWYIMRRDLEARPRGWVTMHEEADHGGRRGDGGRGISRRMIDFLNRLPTTGVPTTWIVSFREALASFLGDVDRVSINVDLNVDLDDPDQARAGQIVTQHVEQRSARSRIAVTVGRDREQRPSERLLQEAKRAGFPVSEFHPPTAFDYYHGGQVYVGTVILWRSKVEPPITAETIAAMQALEPFILFALSDIIARNKASRPIDAAFSDALRRMTADADLSAQEQRIVILQLMGHSYKEMADVLSVTVDTVKKHFKQIHRKTSTHSQSELFAKYFTFRIQD